MIEATVLIMLTTLSMIKLTIKSDYNALGGMNLWHIMYNLLLNIKGILALFLS